MKRRVESAAF
jgi:hypothetical protein